MCRKGIKEHQLYSVPKNDPKVQSSGQDKETNTYCTTLDLCYMIFLVNFFCMGNIALNFSESKIEVVFPWGAQQLRTGCLSILMFLAPLAEVTP